MGVRIIVSKILCIVMLGVNIEKLMLSKQKHASEVA